jgi:hypothetical protein
MITPEDTAELIRSLRENAGRLGFIWLRRYGTVRRVSGLVVEVALDGDAPDSDQSDPSTAHVRANSLIGTVPTYARVAVDSVPPDAHYVIGMIDPIFANPPAAVIGTDDGNATTTSATFVEVLTGGSPAAVSFVAPISGRVMIHCAARMTNNGANDTYVSFYVRTGATIGSGSDVSTPGDNRSSIHVGTTIERQGISHLLTGLTPGASYNARQAFRVGAGTGTYAYRSLIAEPTT